MQDNPPISKPTGNNKMWQAHLRVWRNSGLSGAEYCRQHNLSYHTFTYWKRKIGIHREAPVHFVSVPAVRISPGTTSAPAALKIDLGNRIKIEVHDGFTAATLHRIVSVLSGQ
jgi:hypothetical protein